MTDAAIANAPLATIENEEAVRACVRAFYEVAKSDDLLGPIFNEVIKDWDGHLATMDDFWSAALLGTARYRRAPFPLHLKLDMGQEHFDRWRDLWVAAAKSSMPGDLGARAASMGESMAHCWGRGFVQIKAQMKAREAQAQAGSAS
ncbi:MAG: group III truncated hemoglobin [Alphaproteobacteria bacterium]|nr:group III truncated hemoglobin [Alphaproteobacteria bacterium]